MAKTFWPRAAVLVALCAAAMLACRAAQGPSATRSGVASAEAGAPPPVAPAPTAFEDEAPTGTLRAFEDDAEIRAFGDLWRQQEAARARPAPHRIHPAFPMNGPDADAGAPPPAAVAPAERPSPARAPALAPPSARPSAGESITNNQHADVDEGDIVKLHGEHLVVLRRGRIFTLSLAGGRIQKSKMLDAFGPDIDPSGSWYDEMVVDGDHVVVVGFSYARGGTEIGLFRIDAGGGLTYRETYHLRSNDYYSARNYASRVVDGRLVFYSPTLISAHEPDLAARLPAVRRWSKGARDTEFVRTLPASRLYHVAGQLPSSAYAALHTVTTCDLRAPTLACESVGLVGPPGRVFYVSPSNVYVWTRDWATPLAGGAEGLLAKLPLGRQSPNVTAVRVAGMPTDQFSFDEDEGGALNVLVRSESNGDAMFASEFTSGAAALLRLPLALFSTEVRTASPRRYRQLPRPDGYAVQNRFVGPWLLYGAGQGYVTDHRGGGQLYAVRVAAPEEATTVRLEQGVDRIEPMGDDAVVVGARASDLVFTPIDLASRPRARRDFVRRNAAQGELRSHGFFYKPSAKDPRQGILGLPIRGEGARGGRYLLEGSASVLFVSNAGLELGELGELAATSLRTNQDGCRASCVDWYGNARPIFAKNRVFALMGYELVEGRLDEKGIHERARLSFAPGGGPPRRTADDGY